MPRSTTLRKTAATAVFWLLACLPLFYSLGNHPVYNSSEARYASIGRSMAEGDSPLLIPHWYGQPHLTKPPGFYWLIAGSIRLLGDQPWAIRLPPALCGVGVLIVLHRMSRRLYGVEHARPAVAFAAAMPLFVATHRAAVTDGPLHLCMALTLAAVALALQEHRSRWWLLAGLAAGTGAFIKGPIAWYPLAFGLVWHVLFCRRQPEKRVHLAVLLLAPGFAVMPIALWALYLLDQVPGLMELWRRELIGQRFSDDADHPRSWWYLLIVVLLGLFPATAWLCPPGGKPQAGVTTSNRGEIQSKSRGESKEPPPEWFWWAYALAFTGGLMLMRGQLATYVLPLTFPVAVLAAAGVLRWLGPSRSDDKQQTGPRARYRPHPAGVTLVLAVAFCVGIMGVAVYGWPVPALWLWPIPLLALVGVAMCLMPPHRRSARWRCLSVGWGVMLAAACWAATVEDRLLGRGSTRELVTRADEAVGGPPVTLWTVGFVDETIGYYSRHRPRQVDPRFTPEEWAALDLNQLVLITTPEAWRDWAATRPGLLERRYEAVGQMTLGFPPRRVELYRVRPRFHVEPAP